MAPGACLRPCCALRAEVVTVVRHAEETLPDGRQRALRHGYPEEPCRFAVPMTVVHERDDTLA
jgi:hypothetical protein